MTKDRGIAGQPVTFTTLLSQANVQLVTARVLVLTAFRIGQPMQPHLEHERDAWELFARVVEAAAQHAVEASLGPAPAVLQ